jgi:hypothetical protein
MSRRRTKAVPITDPLWGSSPRMTRASQSPRRQGNRLAFTTHVAVVLLTWLALPLAVVWACRYTVRDIGFVNLRGPEYTLILPVDFSTSTPNATGSEPGDWLESFRQVCRDAGIRVVLQRGSEPARGNATPGAEHNPPDRVPERPAIQSPMPNRTVDNGIVANRSAETDVHAGASASAPSQTVADAPIAARPAVDLRPTETDAVLIDRQGRRLSLNWKLDLHADTKQREVELATLQRQLFSPTAHQLATQSIGSFAQLVLIEGDDPEANARALKVTTEAQQALRKVERLLPRPLAFPIQVQRLTWEQRQQESLLLWALGYDANQQADATHAEPARALANSFHAESAALTAQAKPPNASTSDAEMSDAATRNAETRNADNAPSSAESMSPSRRAQRPLEAPSPPTRTNKLSVPPLLAVVYGRGRLAGRLMVGDTIQLRETLAQLALVGESCECETDRAWFEERTVPLPWNSQARQQAAPNLGFDPDSPLVQAEMVRIISQGKSSRRKPQNGRSNRVAETDSNSASSAKAGSDAGGDSGGDAIERILLGYDELVLAPFPPASSAEPMRSSASTSVGAAERDSPEQLVPNDDTSLQRAGTESSSAVRATVVQGAGWDFETPSRVSPAPHALTPLSGDSGQPQQASDQPVRLQATSTATPASFSNEPRGGGEGISAADSTLTFTPPSNEARRSSTPSLLPASWLALGATLVLVLATAALSAAWILWSLPRK